MIETKEMMVIPKEGFDTVVQRGEDAVCNPKSSNTNRDYGAIAIYRRGFH